ncbi:MAG: hypothetical protein FIA91_05645 [Geobacter sp.]|nr:hypothetical protein [Geobacter sp.]
MRDYSERRQLRTTPPPKRPSILPSLLLIFCLMLVSFAAGGGTGWYLLRPGGKFYKAPPAPPQPEAPKKEAALPPQGEPIAPAGADQGSKAPAQAPAGKGSAAPPLTFYNTLQKGNKGLIGTGINQPKEGTPPPPAKPAAPAVNTN